MKVALIVASTVLSVLSSLPSVDAALNVSLEGSGPNGQFVSFANLLRFETGQQSFSYTGTLLPNFSYYFGAGAEGSVGATGWVDFDFRIADPSLLSSFPVTRNVSIEIANTGQRPGETISYFGPWDGVTAIGSKVGFASASNATTAEWGATSGRVAFRWQRSTPYPAPDDAAHVGAGTSAGYFQVTAPVSFTLSGTMSWTSIDSGQSPGTTQDGPIMPSQVTRDAHFRKLIMDFGWQPPQADGAWIDPPLTDSYDFTINSGSLFTKIADFPTGFSGPFTVSVGGTVLGHYGPGQSVDFTSFPGGGVSGFTVSGIGPKVDVANPYGFALKVDWDTPTANIIMRADVLFGDANRDGQIDADDFALIDRGFAKGLAGWSNGDFDSNGYVDDADYMLIDVAYATTPGNSLSPEVLGDREARFGIAYVTELMAAVPEPHSAGLIGLGVLVLSRRMAARRKYPRSTLGCRMGGRVYRQGQTAE